MKFLVIYNDTYTVSRCEAHIQFKLESSRNTNRKLWQF